MKRLLVTALVALLASPVAAGEDALGVGTPGFDWPEAIKRLAEGPLGPTNVQTTCEIRCNTNWEVCTSRLRGRPSNDPNVVRCRENYNRCLQNCS